MLARFFCSAKSICMAFEKTTYASPVVRPSRRTTSASTASRPAKNSSTSASPALKGSPRRRTTGSAFSSTKPPRGPCGIAPAPNPGAIPPTIPGPNPIGFIIAVGSIAGASRAPAGVSRAGDTRQRRSIVQMRRCFRSRSQKALRDYRAAARSNGCRGSNAYRESRRQARSTRVTHRRSVVSRATGCAARQARPRHRVSPVHHHVTTRDPAKQLAIDFPENQTSFKAHFCTNSTCSRRRPLHAPLPATRSRAPLAFTHRGRTRAPWRRMR